MMNHLFLKHEIDANEERHDQFANDPAALPDEVKARLEAGQLPAWKESAVRAIAFAEARSTKILGIAGIVKGVGNSSITTAVAQAYSDYGQRILLIDAIDANIDESTDAPKSKLLNLTESTTPINKHLHYFDLSRTAFTLPQETEYFRSIFQIALEYYHAIIIDLPPIVTTSGQPASSNLAIGAACDAVFMVCETGRTTQAQVQQGLASSKISGMKVEGLLLNDYRLPMNRILSKF
jgi:Mrp family chromosome partitioning ATPase